MSEKLPVILTRERCILPGMIVQFDVTDEKDMRAVRAAMGEGQRLLLVPLSDGAESYDDLTVGTVAAVRQSVRIESGGRLLVEGTGRAEILRIAEVRKCLRAEAVPFQEENDLVPDPACAEAMRGTLLKLFRACVAMSGDVGPETAERIEGIEDVSQMMDQISINVPMPAKKQRRILETRTTSERYAVICAILTEEEEIQRYRRELNGKIRERVDRNQKEYILHEQMKVIRRELGEDQAQDDVERFRKECAKLEAKPEIRERIGREIGRLAKISEQSPESQVLRGYIETLLSLPWDRAGEDSADLKRAKEILDRDHYGLTKVKERILEFLAVRQLTRKGETPILCLVGPPGTGKTSIGRSVAEALNKKYIRLSLGGVHDEAEIRGHRRTYVGAMPGRIVGGLRQAGVKNPLMVLDEVDKVSADYRGDTASALLEVLDAEQNCRFEDHYVEIPVDLSEVMFIATANDPQRIPGPLLDRMEVIEISSYTENEKFHIAREHLLPKQIRRNGLAPEQLSVSDRALYAVISRYTREAGVRQLERELGRIARKTARMVLEDGKRAVRVTDRNLVTFLGNPKYTEDAASGRDEVGIVRGLAWTAVGGVTLETEVNVMPGKGELKLTGKLGDVMKESAQAGISYIRSIAGEHGIPEDYFAKHDIHLHIPEGAVPKDGPSAGITMATAIFSAITERPVRADVAMTGEITLRGRVLPIGGLKEKLLAAKKAGIRTVVVPEKNRPDVQELTREITGGMEMVYAAGMEEVLRAALR